MGKAYSQKLDLTFFFVYTINIRSWINLQIRKCWLIHFCEAAL